MSTPAVVESGAVPGHEPARPLPLLAVAGLLGVAATAFLALAGLGLGRNGRIVDLWFFTVSGLSERALGEATAVTLTMVALAVLAAAWFVLSAALHRGAGVGAVLLVGGLWALPLLAGPPLFSPDAYAYAAIGSAIQHGVDPFVQGPAAAGDIPGTRGAEDFWAESPTPYSPPFVVLLNLFSKVFSEDLLHFLVGMRVLVVVVWALLAYLVVRLARHRGLDPARTVWLTVANPLLLLHSVSGLHNDALMTLLVMAGMAAALGDRPYLAVTLVAAGASVKVTALALVPVIAVYAAWQLPEWSRRLRVLVGTGALGLAVFALGVQVSGYGWRWTENLDVPGKAVEPLSPPTALAVLIDYDDPPLDLVRGIGLGIGVLVCLWLLTRVPRWGLLTTAGWVSLTVVLSGAAMWPWYLTLPTVLFALTGRRGHAWMVTGWSVAGLFLALPGGQATLSLLSRPFTDGAVLVVLLALGAAAVWVRRRGRNDRAPEDQTPVERHSRARSSAT
ncbi:polyprenol phosphomannose-dependent alpha 1,6 mannosyltransferase MptB [Blastococcus sp. URHD0036]|uniref:polyprenol phosphomannose-dependent alpha 1,6 mannosyltransferase MptB n=1 Tax=Blastococcus sp. URHD0036 TaxID=1380356 RepID=UPI0012DBD093|nr:polyprenol phosphomannose-dependent alpha 1,6 mannosyltransferase MptB [Blastococcus sp. URHD0036]